METWSESTNRVRPGGGAFQLEAAIEQRPWEGLLVYQQLQGDQCGWNIEEGRERGSLEPDPAGLVGQGRNIRSVLRVMEQGRAWPNLHLKRTTLWWKVDYQRPLGKQGDPQELLLWSKWEAWCPSLGGKMVTNGWV